MKEKSIEKVLEKSEKERIEKRRTIGVKIRALVCAMYVFSFVLRTLQSII